MGMSDKRKKCPQWDSNLGFEKEGCAERIARFGTLSQNGYGAYEIARAGTYPVQGSNPSAGLKGSERLNVRLWGSNQDFEKEGCAERIARSGTLSQNGYGDHLSRHAGTYPVRSTLGVRGPDFRELPEIDSATPGSLGLNWSSRRRLS